MNLAPARAVLGDVEVQKLSKRHIDDLVIKLRAGGLPTPTGKNPEAVVTAFSELHAGSADCRAARSDAARPRGA